MTGVKCKKDKISQVFWHILAFKITLLTSVILNFIK